MAERMRHKERHHHQHKSAGIMGSFLKIFFIILFLACGIFLLYKIGPDIFSNKFDSANRFNVAISSPDKTAFLSIYEGEGRGTVIQFPKDLYILSVAHGYGQYPLDKVYGVGQLDNRGGTVLSDTMAMFLGVPVDGYFRVENFSSDDVRGLILSPTFLLGKNTDINIWDRILIAKALFEIRFDKIKHIDLSHKASSLLLADGSKVKVLLPEDLDNILRDDFSEVNLLKEALRVQIVNTTGVAGLGNAFARVISSLGSSVIDVESTEGESLSNCKIEAEKKVIKSKTVSRIAKALGCEVVESKNSGRADVVVYLAKPQAGIFGK